MSVINLVALLLTWFLYQIYTLQTVWFLKILSCLKETKLNKFVFFILDIIITQKKTRNNHGYYKGCLVIWHSASRRDQNTKDRKQMSCWMNLYTMTYTYTFILFKGWRINSKQLVPYTFRWSILHCLKRCWYRCVKTSKMTRRLII